MVHEVIKLPKTRIMVNVFGSAIGDSTLVAKGKKWLHNRRLLTPAFHYEILKGYVPIVNSCLEVFVKKWIRASKEGQGVLVFGDITRLSMDVIMRCAFNTETNCQLGNNMHPYCTVMLEIFYLLAERLHMPLHWNFFVCSLTANGRRFIKAKKVTEIFVDSMIRERKEIIEAKCAALSKQHN